MPSYLAGIDEAGYGPTLGPLVISAVVFETPAPQTNLLKLLRRIISPYPRQDKLTVCDSKKIYSPARGLSHLEKTVLAFLGQYYPSILENRTRLTAKTILETLIPDSLQFISGLPWYRDIAYLSLPLKTNLSELQPLIRRLAKELVRNSVRFTEVRIRLVTASEFNREINGGCNKADLLFNQTGRLLSYLYQQYLNNSRNGSAEFTPLPTWLTTNGCVYAGKQGGRTYYQTHLKHLFGTNEIKTVKESADCSAYRVGLNNQIEFVRNGEDRYFVIALASIFSKYVRELFMAVFNNFWQKHRPGLKPTAGYPADARRFLNEIDFFIKKSNLKREDLIRMR